MGCRTTNLTKERFINARIGGESFVTPFINQTQEETNELVLGIQKVAAKVNEKYVLFGTEELEKRVSELSKRKMGLSERSISDDNEIAREGGTYVHAVMRDLLDAIINSNGSVEAIKNKALSRDDFKLTLKQFTALEKSAIKLKENIDGIQKSIGEGKAKVYLECFLCDAIRNIGGTLDVLVVFSDNTGAIYDFKTTGSTERNNPIGLGPKGKEVKRSPLPFADIKAYDISMTEYKRIATEVFGVKSIRQNRLIPIVVNFKNKKTEESSPGSSKVRQFTDIIGTNDPSDFMKPIPVGGERSEFVGINKLLEKQYNLIKQLDESVNKNVSEEYRIEVRDKISRLEKGIITALVDNDISSMLYSMGSVIKQVNSRLEELEVDKKGNENPRYLNILDSGLLLAEMEVYDDIIINTNDYFEDLQENHKEKFNSLKKSLKEIESDFQITHLKLQEHRTQLTLEEAATRYKDEKGNLISYPELTLGDETFLKLSSIDSPIFQIAWQMIQEEQYDIKQKFNKLNDNVSDKTDALFKWASENGISRPDVFKMIINEKTGNLYSKLDSKFYDKIVEALEEKDDDAIKFMKNTFEIRDKKKFEEGYKIRLEHYKKVRLDALNNLKTILHPDGKRTSSATLKKQYEGDIKFWEDQNDLIHSPKAWVNKINKTSYLKMKDSVVEEHLSSDYNKFKNIQPVKEYYEMWIDYMEEFSNLLGIQHYSDLPYNFIPNIRKEMVEYLNADNLNIAGAISEFIESFSVREEDVYIGTTSEDGLVRKIPVLFLNKIIDPKTKKIDNSRKSYDLSTSLKIFGHMAYNYEHMNKIEPKILTLRNLMAAPGPEQGAMQVRDRLGRKVIGKILPYLTKKGEKTDTYKLFEDITDYYLYGIKFKGQSPILGMDVAHLLTKSKNANSMMTLGFAVIPAAGAYGAGKIGSFITAKKGMMYTDTMFYQAAKWMVQKADVYKGLCEFIDPENDSYLERALQEDMTTSKRKWASARTLFAFLRKADKNIMRHIMVSMSQNFGVTPEGGIIRFKKGVDRSKYKSIWEATVLDEKGKATVEGLSKKGYIAFRQAVKNTAAEVIGNMNPDDIGKMDVSLLTNQYMAFRSWAPELVRERFGKLRYDPVTQAMKGGRFRILSQEFRSGTTEQEKIDINYMKKYLAEVLLPKATLLLTDIITMGVFPSQLNKKRDIQRARLHYEKWLNENPSAKADGVTFEDFLEIKEAQIKAVLMEIRVLCLIAATSLMLGMKGDDGKPLYYSNRATRTLFKIFTKMGSELTFMWNPGEAQRLITNPFPTARLLTLFIKTMINTTDETRDTLFGENSKQDKAPSFYYTSQWIYGVPQLTRLFEVFENQKKTPYQIFQLQ